MGKTSAGVSGFRDLVTADMEPIRAGARFIIMLFSIQTVFQVIV